MSAFLCKKYWFKKAGFVQLTVDVVDFNKKKKNKASLYECHIGFPAIGNASFLVTRTQWKAF